MPKENQRWFRLDTRPFSTKWTQRPQQLIHMNHADDLHFIWIPSGCKWEFSTSDRANFYQITLFDSVNTETRTDSVKHIHGIPIHLRWGCYVYVLRYPWFFFHESIAFPLNGICKIVDFGCFQKYLKKGNFNNIDEYSSFRLKYQYQHLLGCLYSIHRGHERRI